MDNELILDDQFKKKINEKLLECLDNYRKTLSYIAGDVPLEVLCLPKATETILRSNGVLRVYDLFDMDFTEVKGLGETRINDLTSRLHEFLSMGI